MEGIKKTPHIGLSPIKAVQRPVEQVYSLGVGALAGVQAVAMLGYHKDYNQFAYDYLAEFDWAVSDLAFYGLMNLSTAKLTEKDRSDFRLMGHGILSVAFDELLQLEIASARLSESWVVRNVGTRALWAGNLLGNPLLKIVDFSIGLAFLVKGLISGDKEDLKMAYKGLVITSIVSESFRSLIGILNPSKAPG